MWSIVVHAGVADFIPTPEQDTRMKELIEIAKSRGASLLKSGKSCTDAVEETIKFMENTGEFNAGKGSVRTQEETKEMDAAIMNGKDLSWGAVGYVTDIENPITAARDIMSEANELLLVGKGAESYVTNNISRNKKRKGYGSIYFDLGTVGCVAMDKHGNICAGISSGGAYNKPSGRIGNASIIGAGIYANNETCGLSTSGIGEEFIRYSLCNTVHCLMKFGKMNFKGACSVALELMPPSSVGIIGIDNNGNIISFTNCKKFYTTSQKSGVKVDLKRKKVVPKRRNY